MLLTRANTMAKATVEEESAAMVEKANGRMERAHFRHPGEYFSAQFSERELLRGNGKNDRQSCRE